MTYCSRCGVEVEERAEACPLCEAPIQRLDEPREDPARYPEVVAAPDRQVRYLVWILSTAALSSITLTLVTLDVVLNHRITWSLYPLMGAGVIWLLITLVVALARRPIFVIVGQAVATGGFLFLIDISDGHLHWFAPLALPIVAVVTGASVLVWLVARLSRRAPALIAAAVLAGCAAGSVAVDLLVSAYLGTPGMSWSFVVLGAAVPLMVFLLYFHIRLGRRLHLGRIMHR
jgi:peptidoglycan/LPS O-acetylase OafA/YrhL